MTIKENSRLSTMYPQKADPFFLRNNLNSFILNDVSQQNQRNLPIKVPKTRVGPILFQECSENFNIIWNRPFFSFINWFKDYRCSKWILQEKHISWNSVLCRSEETLDWTVIGGTMKFISWTVHHSFFVFS